MKRIAHIINGLDNGGAEAVLYRLVINDRAHEHIVISLKGMGHYGEALLQEGITVYCLNREKEKLTILSILKLPLLLKQLSPDIVQTWLYTADFIGGLSARLSNISKIYWGVHHFNLDRSTIPFRTAIFAKLCALTSHWIPHKIITCARASVAPHVAIGYKESKFVVINNGYDFSDFKPNKAFRESIRNELGISENSILIGMIARFNPQKDHKTMIAAIEIAIKHNGSLLLALVGPHISKDNVELIRLLKEAGLERHVILLGERRDIAKIINALDFHALSSVGEAFPNVIVESMACGVPCIATDVGDTREIIDIHGWVVEPSDPNALSAAILQACDEIGTNRYIERKTSSRESVINRYDITAILAKYCNAWEDIKS